jgi:hypothetical protein
MALPQLAAIFANSRCKTLQAGRPQRRRAAAGVAVAILKPMPSIEIAIQTRSFRRAVTIGASAIKPEKISRLAACFSE